MCQNILAKSVVLMGRLFDAINKTQTMRSQKIFQRARSQYGQFPYRRIALNNRNYDRPCTLRVIHHQTHQFIICPRE